MDQDTLQHHASEQKNTHVSFYVNKKKMLYIVGGIGVLLVIIVTFVVMKSLSTSQSSTTLTKPSTAPTPTIPLTTEYDNPFDTKSSYENPFSGSEEYQNPFDTGQ